MATNDFDWQAVLAKGQPAGYKGGPIVTTHGQQMTPELQAALDYNKALRYQSAAQRKQEADQQYGAGNYTMTQAGAMPTNKSALQPSQAAQNDTSGFTVGGTATGTPNMKTHYQQNPSVGGGVGGAGSGAGGTGGASGGGTGGGTGGSHQQSLLAAAQAGQWTPELAEWLEKNSVEGRTAAMLKNGSPLLERAQTLAQQQANASGVLNSTMAAEAGTSAMTQQAAQIAGADAQLIQQQGLANQAAKNDAAKSNAGLYYQALSDAVRLGESSRQFDAEQQNRLLQQQRDIELRKYMAELDVANREKMAELDNKWRAKVQADDNLAGAWGSMMQNIGNIQNNPQLKNETKATLIQQTITQFDSFAQWSSTISGSDVSALLNFEVDDGQGGSAGSAGGTGSTGGAPAWEQT